MQRHEHELLKYAVSGVVCGMDRRRLWLLVGVLVLLTVFGLVAAVVWRGASPGAPDLLPPPFLRLRDLYEEPNGHGWGVDLPGYGPTLTFSPLQAHTLKPASVPHQDGHLTPRADRLEFSGAGAGRCLQAAAARLGSTLAAVRCGANIQLQRWRLEGGLVRLAGTQLCLTVAGRETERPAGRWTRRDLSLQSCTAGRDQLWDAVE